MRFNESNVNEIVVCSDCSYNDFVSVAEIVKHSLDINYLKKIGDYESHYWDFEFDGVSITIHYNLYLGISIFPKKEQTPTEIRNQTMIEIFDKLSNIYILKNL